MVRLRALRVGFALALLFVGTTIGEDKCRSGCHGSGSQTFKYAEGTTYKYNFESNIDVALSSAEGQQSNTKLKATVLLTQLPQCNQLLRLQNVQVIGPDAKKYSHLADIDKPIRINFHDGHIEDSICAEPGDNQNSLNIKRAVASLFQANLKQHYETDVFGVCPTEVVSRKEGPSVIVQKSRNLNKCSHRESIKQDFFATAFNLNSEIKSSPVLSGEYTAEQRIKNGILDYAEVTEHYLYVPFSVGTSGAKATVSTKIQLAGQSKESPAQKVSVPRTIIFENPHIVTSDKSNVDSIQAALKETKNQVDLTVGEHTAKSFVNLIKILRASKKNDILTVYGQVKAGAGFKDKSGAKQVFLDALFRAGTGDTVEVGIELLKSKELSPLEQKFVFLGLAFVKHATLDSLTSAAGLLDQPNLPREAYLGVGTLAGRYCREHSCENQPAVDQLVQKLLSKLGDGKANNRQSENQVISVLKALGNVEFLNDAVVTKVSAIAQDKKAPNRVRVAALETLLTDACKDKVRDSALHVLKDIQQDSEIRIKAYLVVAQCPNGKVANALKNLLDKEPCYQVGGFILSHLRHLKASANPDKELAKHQLGNVATTKKFPIDLRKYSSNNEVSYSIDTLGVASSAEANIIYSQESFLPRSTSLNLTAQLFGHTFNFLELGTRQENLDRLLEHYFGPLGVLSESSAEDLVNNGKASLEKIVHHLRERFAKTRGKRDVSKAELDGINKDVQIKTHKLNADLDVDLSVKLFGSELLFLSINDQADSLSPNAIIDKIFDCLDDGIAKAKNFEKSIQSNLLFIDSEFSYPTSMGFPLRLSVEGSSSVQVKTAGKIDVQAILRGDRAPLKISLIPSANIDITGSITVDAQVVEGGLKVASSLYTATGGDLEVILLEDNKGIDLKFSIPVEEQKLVSVNHEIVFTSRELGRSEVVTPLKFGQNKDFSICMDQLSPFIGLVFCADINNPPSISKHGPPLPFPLSGHAKFSVGIQREDLSLYHYKSLVHNEPGKLGGEFTIEVLGAKNNKKVELHVEAFASPEIYINAKLISPILSASADARVVSNNQETSLALQVQLDQQRYLAKAGVSISGGGGKTVYKPLIQYDGPGLQGQKLPLNVEGSLIVESKPNEGYYKYIFDNLRLVSSSNNKAISVQGNFGRDKSALFSDITVSDGSNSGSLKGKVQYEANALKLNVEVTNSVNPNINLNVKYDFKHSPIQIDSNLQIIHGADLSSKVNRFTLTNFMMRKYKSSDDFETRTNNKLSYPLIQLDSKLDYEVKPKTLKYDVELQYGQLKAGSELEVKISQRTPGDYQVEFELYGLEFKVELDAKREIQGDKSKLDNALVINGKKFEVSGTVTHHLKSDDYNVGADLVIKVPGVAEAIKLNSALITKPGDLDTHFKLSAGATVFVDALLKADKGGNANGNLKINLKDLLVSNGQLHVANGVGNGNIVIDLVRVHRKLKADTSFTVQAPIYNLQLSFFFDFERDNNNKISLDSKNQIKSGLVDSKNVLELLGKKLEGNVRAATEGQLNDGKQNVAAEVILPNNAYFGFKMDRDVHIVNNIGSGNVFASWELRPNKNTPGRKLTIKGTGKNLDFNEKYFDIAYNIVAEGDGKNCNTDLVLKRQPQGDKILVDIQAKAYGSALSSPRELNLHALYKDNQGTVSESLKVGSDFSLVSNAKYDFSETSLKGDCDITLTTPSSGSAKFTASGNVARPKEDEIKYNVAIGLQGDKVNIKVESDGSVSPKSGQLRGTCHTQGRDPLALDLGYNVADDKKFNYHVNLQTSNNNAIKADLTLLRPHEHEYKADGKLTTPTADIRLEIGAKRSPDGKNVQGEIALTADGKRYVLTNELVLSDLAPALDVQLIFPDGKIDRILVKVNRVSPKHLTGELKLVFGQTNFNLDSNLDANVESIDDFSVKLSTNCAALQLDNLIVEAHNKQGAKGGKRIQVSAQAGGQNILSGSTTYKAREEGDKFIIEGSGSLKVKEDSKQANFKFVRQTLSAARNGEDGIEITFDAGLGKKAVDAELKLTNKQFHLLNSYCEEKKQCAHVEVDSKIINSNPGEFHHELEVAVDLRKLGLSHEFGLKGVTTRKGFVLDHTVDVYFQNKENKYQYSLFVHPSEAGAQLTTPKRVISLEGRFEVPQQGKRPLKGEIALYLNKKSEPNKKTALLYNSECHRNSPNEGSGNCNSELRFVNPALSKDFYITHKVNVDEKGKTVNYEIVVDILPNPNQKLVISGKGNFNRVGNSAYAAIASFEAHSAGLNINLKAEEQAYIDTSKPEFKYGYTLTYDVVGSKHDSAIVAQINPQQAQFVIKALNKELVNVVSRLQLSEERAVADTNINIFGVPPSVSHFEASIGKVFYTIARAANPNDKLQVLAVVEPGKEASINADLIKGGASKNLARITMKLDEAHFLKTDSAVNSENIKSVGNSIKGDVEKFANEIRRLGEDSLKQTKVEAQKVFELLQQNAGSLKPVKEYYQQELQKIREEIISDKTLKEVGQFLDGVFGAVFKVLSEVLGRANELIEAVVQVGNQQFGKVINIIQEGILPRLLEISKSILNAAATVLESAADVAFAILAKISSYIEAHQAEINQILGSFSGITQEIGRFLYAIYKEAQTVVTKEWKNISEGLRNMPIAEELKARYDEMVKGSGLPAIVLNTVRELLSTLKDAVPSEDCKNLIGTIIQYLDKKIRNEQVDDFGALQNIIRTAITIIQKLIGTIPGGKDFQFSDNFIPFLSGDLTRNLPRLVSSQFSPLGYFVNGDLPSPAETLAAISLHPKDYIPPYKLDAVVIQGQHIFTFDGKHITFPGNCNYLLAHDAINGNFTLVGTFTNGLLTAITLADKHDSITLKKGGLVLLNNAAQEFPVRKQYLEAFRLYESMHLFSKAGIEVICGSELLVCGVHVSGFYHGQLRGLLGNGNFEPYDDYTLPNGKIVTSESEFGNAYKAKANCPPVKVVDHNAHHHNPACNKLFGSDSPLRICYNSVNPENYRTACEHGLAAGVKDTEKAVAIGYVASCRAKKIPVSVPGEYVKCENGDKPYDVGTTFSVKTPGKAADVIVIVDQTKSNEVVYKELVQPLIQQITSDLSAKGVTDVEFHLLGYGGDYQAHPSHYTVAGKLTFKGRSPNLKFADSPKEITINTGCEHTDRFINILKAIFGEAQLITGQTIQQRTYSEALEYPFRANAVKSIVAVVGKPCEKGHLVGLQKLRALFFANEQISLNLVTPFDDFNVKDAKHTKNVIGFNAHNVFSTSDAKKKPEGSPELYGDLSYDDYCVDFTLKNRGNVFVTNNFIQAKAPQRKQFTQVAAHNIVEQLLNVEQGLDCVCELVTPYSAQNVCEVSYSHERAVPAKKGGHKG